MSKRYKGKNNRHYKNNKHLYFGGKCPDNTHNNNVINFPKRKNYTIEDFKKDNPDIHDEIIKRFDKIFSELENAPILYLEEGKSKRNDKSDDFDDTDIDLEELFYKDKPELSYDMEDRNMELIKKRYNALNYTIDDLFEQIKKSIIGQDEAVKKLLFMVYNNQYLNMLEDLSDIDIKRIHGIAIGPSGVGKTASISKIAKLFDVPYVKYNATQLTSAGYVGNDVDSIITSLIKAAGDNIEEAQRGIIFIDEIDKKVASDPSANTSKRDINGTAVQEELLKLLEPSVIYVGKTNDLKAFDTHKLTIILGGRFKGLEKIRSDRLNGKKTIGFGNNKSNNSGESKIVDFIPDDLIKFGFIDEFVGRITTYSEFKKLSADTIEDIIYAKDSIFMQYLGVFDSRGVTIEIDPINFRKIAEKIAGSDTGARDLERLIIEFLRPALYDTEQNYCSGICTYDYNGNYYSIFEDRITHDIKENSIKKYISTILDDDDEEEEVAKFD